LINKIKIIAIIIARLDSKRFPGKVLKKINGKPIIKIIHDRVSSIKDLDRIIIATSNRIIDNPIIFFAKKNKINFYRGSYKDVAQRCCDAAKFYEADYFLRLNADSPFPDIRIIKKGINFLKINKPDLITNLIKRTFPYGISLEIIKVKSLEKSIPLMTEYDSEHVTNFFYKKNNFFKIIKFYSKNNLYSNLKMVLDSPGDLKILKYLAKKTRNKIFNMNYNQIAKKYGKYFN
jgi:spore coat polysaccharide biosynthesis protein SpsF